MTLKRYTTPGYHGREEESPDGYWVDACDALEVIDAQAATITALATAERLAMAQVARDADLAAEWKQTAEDYRVAYETERTRADRAEAEVERHKRDALNEGGHCIRCEDECNRLRAEVERLRALVAEVPAPLSSVSQDWIRRRDEAASLRCAGRPCTGCVWCLGSDAWARGRAARQADAQAAEFAARIDAIESLHESALNERDSAHSALEAAESECAALRAEVERLRALHEHVAESRLAAATELLGKVRAEIRTCETEAAQRDPEDEVRIQADGYRHIRASLAARPAAPARAEECLSCNREVLVPAPDRARGDD